MYGGITIKEKRQTSESKLGLKPEFYILHTTIRAPALNK
jgi:hypothetical protein